jgi:hypothetical protein
MTIEGLDIHEASITINGVEYVPKPSLPDLTPPEKPPIGTLWQHKDGDVYMVCMDSRSGVHHLTLIKTLDPNHIAGCRWSNKNLWGSVYPRSTFKRFKGTVIITQD